MEKILVMGSLNMDFAVYVDEVPAEGRTVLANRSERIPGGKGANQAYAAGWLGAEVAMIGAVGGDESGRELIENLNRVNVNTDAVSQIAGAPTGYSHISINWRKGKRTIVVPCFVVAFPSCLLYHTHGKRPVFITICAATTATEWSL